MGGIGPNVQLKSDGPEIVCVIRAPHKTYAYQIFGQNISYLRVMGKNKCARD